MVFSSLSFLYLFLPISLTAYYITPDKGKNAVLWLVSLLFYGWGEPVYVSLMIFSTILDYCMGWLADHYRDKWQAKAALLISMCANLGLLGFFKYSDFFITNINELFGANIQALNLKLPIGISFYTFQTMSYTIDVYRNKVCCQKDFISFGAFVALFPQLIAGPIVRYRDIEIQLKNRKFSYQQFSDGVIRFILGLGKKVILANNIGLLFSQLTGNNLASLSVFGSWLAINAFSFQIYFDFSGYSDMAIGLGKMFGFDFPENFNYPYMSLSCTDFWRRWHMTLGSWFRDYVYIPLGGNKTSKLRWLVNIIVVWLLTGFWHGANWNYILWGLLFAMVLIIEKLFLNRWTSKFPITIRWLGMWIVLQLSWVLFVNEDFASITLFLKNLLGIGNEMFDPKSIYLFANNIILLVFCAVFSTTISKSVYHWYRGLLKENIADFLDGVVLIVIMMISTAYLVSGSYNPFLYFRF